MGLTISQLNLFPSPIVRMNRYNQGYDDYMHGSEPNDNLINDEDYLRGWRRAHKNVFSPDPLTYEEIGV